MKKFDHVWSYACIDFTALDIDPESINKQMMDCELVAQLCMDAGVDIMEAGTPMLYAFGYECVARLRCIVGPDFPLAADPKAQDGCQFFFNNYKRYGADYATVCVVNNDGGFEAALDAKKDCGIKVVADLYATPVDQLVARAMECEKKGADIIQLHFGAEENMYNIYPGRRDSDYVKEVAEAIDVPLFVVANEPKDVERAIRDGADCILFGLCLVDNSAETFEATKKFVEMVHEFDRKYNN